MDAQNRLPEVATDQFALDRTLKHLRKLRWIGRESEGCRKTEISDLSQHEVAKLRPLPLPAWLALAAFPEPPGTPFALRRAMFREERKKKYPACARMSPAIAQSRGTGEATD
jgi:hypothetical protein